MHRWLLVVALLAGTAYGAGKETQLADQLVPRQIRVSFATEQLFVSVRSRVSPASIDEASWATWDRDGDGSLSDTELGPLLDFVTRVELGHLGVTVDGTVVPVAALKTKLEVPVERPVALDASLVLRFEGKQRTALAAGEHRFAVYDQPLGRDGVVPFRVSFGRGLHALGGGGARAEIRGGGKRVEVATTQLAPIFWGRFVRKDEAKPR